MEKTLTLYVASLNQQWELPDSLALKWTEYEKAHPVAGDNHNADQRHTDWLATLSPQEQGQIARTTPEE